MSIKTLEERIVNLTKVSAGVETTEQAELRQLDMRGEDPYRITVVLAKEFGVQITMDWNSSISKFSTEIGGITWYSDFDYGTYKPQVNEYGSVARSPRRGRNSTF